MRGAYMHTFENAANDRDSLLAVDMCQVDFTSLSRLTKILVRWHSDMTVTRWIKVPYLAWDSLMVCLLILAYEPFEFFKIFM